MNTLKNTASVEAQPDVIVLGVASIETKGRPGKTEFTGDMPVGGITED